MEKVEGYIFTSKEYKPYFDFWEGLNAQEKNKFFFAERNAVSVNPERKKHTWPVDSDTLKIVTKLVGEQDAGVFLIFASLYGLLLQKYTGEERIILDSPLYNIPANTRLYASKVPLIFDVSRGLMLKEYFEQCQGRIKSIYKYQNFPLALLRNNSDQQQFQTNVAFRFDTLHQHFTNTSTYDLVVEIEKSAGSYNLVFDFTTKFSETFISHIPTHFKQLLKCVENLNTALDSISVVDQDERRILLEEFNNTFVELPSGANLKNYFEEQVILHPQSIALQAGNVSLTYDVLNREANKVANFIHEEYDVSNQDIIAVITGRNERMIIAIIGILKAGAAFLPIDSTFPKARKELILADAGVKLLLTESDFMFDLDQYTGAMMMLDIQMPDLDKADTNPSYNVGATDLAYVIYTSGSTGKPKGVMIEHRSAVNMCLDQIKKFDILNSDKVLQLASCSFDASISEIFKTFLAGATLVMVEQKILKEPKSLFAYIKHHEVSVVTFPPSFLATVDVGELSGLRVIISAGEAAKPETALACIKYVNYFNAYGPTECTVCVSIQNVNAYIKNKKIDAVHSVPIGKPLANTTVYLLDANNNLVPIGVPGEICVSGIGLSRGYLNNDELTVKHFVPNLFQPGTLMYRTGDRARWLPGGELEYLGRKDHQVKIRGHRVELGEIQSVMESFSEIKQALVLALDDAAHEKTVVAYFSASEELDASRITEKLKSLLPHYLIPAHMIRVDDFPLNKQGKINRNVLPNPFEHNSKVNYAPPTNDTEKRMAAIWENVLGHQRIGINDDFFLLGGDSIKAIRLVGEINKQLKADLEVKDVFTQPSIGRLLMYLQKNNHKNDPAIKKAADQIEALKQSILSDGHLRSLLPEDYEDFYPASDIQIGMLYHNLLDAEAGVFHDQMFHQLNDHTFDVEVFYQAVGQMVEKHPVLRTSFDFRSFECSMQIVHTYNTGLFDIDVEDLSHLEAHEQKQYLKNYLQQDIHQSFDISKPGLWRIRVFKLTGGEVGVLLVFHHAIIDGWSDNSFSAELSQVYFALKTHKNFKVPPLKATYKDYVIDQIRHKQSTDIRSFWQKELENFDGVELPFNRLLSAASKKKKSINKTFFIQPSSVARISKYSKDNIIPVKHILFAAYLFLIKKLTGRNNVCAGLVSNGRPDKIDGDKILGCFLNTIPFIHSFEKEMSAHEFLKHIHARCIALKSYDKLSLPEIMRIRSKSMAAYNHMVDVSFNYVDFYITKEISSEENVSQPLVNGSGNNPAPFAFSIKKVNDNIRVNIVYLEELFTAREINSIATYYQNILDNIIDPQLTPLHKINILDPSETESLLADHQGKIVEYKASTLASAFEHVVKTSPQATAVVSDTTELTYHELNVRVNRLANYLRTHFNIFKEDRIALLLNRNEEFIIALLAVLKTGASIIPLSIEMPPGRIQSILNDAVTITTLVHHETASAIPLKDVTNLDVIREQVGKCSSENPDDVSMPSDLAYIVYTSGTTGLPKGSMVTHQNILNTIRDQIQEFLITAADNIIQLAAPTFDVAMYEIFMALNAHATIVMVSKDVIDEPKRFVQYLNDKAVSLMAVTPGYLNLLPWHEIKSLRTIITGGESAKMTDALQCGQMFKYYNSFGPTECSVCISTYQLDVSQNAKRISLPIGKPLSNTKIFIVDDMMQLVPQGVIGEMLVQGNGVTRGYLNNPELTAEKFIDSPFEKGSKVYRTGDLAMWNQDELLEFMGRNDKQLKINGHRIEPDEITDLLVKHPDVQNAHVLLRKVPGKDETLAGYVVSNKNTITGWREFLAKRLPAYMIPSFIVVVPAFPLNENGKIDDKRLEACGPIELQSANSLTIPSNVLENEICELWREVLGMDQISTTRSFFETGGNSLTLIRVFNKLSIKYKELRMADLFTYPTISSLASFLMVSNSVEQDAVLAAGFNV